MLVSVACDTRLGGVAAFLPLALQSLGIGFCSPVLLIELVLPGAEAKDIRSQNGGRRGRKSCSGSPRVDLLARDRKTSDTFAHLWKTALPMAGSHPLTISADVEECHSSLSSHHL